MRVDKTRIAGLAATLIHYVKGEALREIPVWRMISMPLSEIDQRAKTWTTAINNINNLATVTDGESLIGGGSLPGTTLPTRLVAIADMKKPGLAQKVARRLRYQEIPIIGRISENILLLDPRTVAPQEDETIVNELVKAIESLK
jgi:L-seryl-tRNA(Ser) seleniumtransferase